MVTCITSNTVMPVPLYSADFSLGLIVSGVNDVAFNGAGRMFVANRSVYGVQNLIGAGDPSSLILEPAGGWMFDVTYIMGIGQQKSIAIPSDGNTLYMVTEAPDALIRFAVANDPYGIPTLQALDYVLTGVDPSRVFMLETDSPKRRLLYIPCVDSNFVHVIDGFTMEQVDLLEYAFDGPYWMAFYDAPAGKRALVANFESSQISVISIDPVTLEHKFLANVGPPRVIESGGY
jgi:DNA-binding beta-propeller fold protein YncE